MRRINLHLLVFLFISFSAHAGIIDLTKRIDDGGNATTADLLNNAGSDLSDFVNDAGLGIRERGGSAGLFDVVGLNMGDIGEGSGDGNDELVAIVFQGFGDLTGVDYFIDATLTLQIAPGNYLASTD